MAKKNFTSGIDALLSSTVSKEPTGADVAPIRRPVHQSETEKCSLISFRMRDSLIKQMKFCCIENKLKQQELIVTAIENYIKAFIKSHP